MAAPTVPPPSTTFRFMRSRPLLIAGLLVGVGLLLVAMMSSIAFGAAASAPAMSGLRSSTSPQLRPTL